MASSSVQRCSRRLACGHQCGGTQGEKSCPPCLEKSCFARAIRANDMLNENCPICIGDHDDEPTIQLACGHLYHFDCVRTQVVTGRPGVVLTFEFLRCYKCKPKSYFIKHDLLQKELKPLLELRARVEDMSVRRLKMEGLMEHKDIKDVHNRYFNKPTEFAMARYAYYQCFRCLNPYFGGTKACESGDSDRAVDKSLLLCGGCSPVAGVDGCSKHQKQHMTFKCRFCCSIAVFFCFGTTHFCNTCHANHSMVQKMQTEKRLPACPVGPKAVPLGNVPCPLGIPHPPTGTEFAISCAMCLAERSC